MAKRKRIIGAAIAVCVVACLWCVFRKAPEAFILELQVVDADTAVLTWRNASRGFISRVDAQGRTTWWRELPDAPLDGHALRIGPDVVAVRYSHGHTDQAIVAFSLDDGAQLWDRVLGPYNPTRDEGRSSSPTLNSDFSGTQIGDYLVERVDSGQRSFLVGLDLQTGRELWRTDPGSQFETPWISERHLLLNETFRAHTIDVLDGTTTRDDIAGHGCMVDGEYVTIVGTGPYSLVALRPGELTHRVIEHRLEVPGIGRLNLRSCGRYRDRLVFSLDLGFGADGTSLVLITDLAGQRLHVIRLPYDMRWTSVGTANSHPESAPLSGELTRFAPFLQDSLEGERRRSRLIMFDLENGSIAWEGPYDRRVNRTSLFRVGSLWYWAAPDAETLTLSVFDGGTGQLRSAIRAQVEYGVRIGPMQVRDGRLWIHSGEWTPLDEPTLSVFDTTTWVPQSRRAGELTAVTDAVRNYLEGRAQPQP